VGWLLVEEPDYISAVADPRSATEAYAKKLTAVRQHVTAAGFDWHYGRRLLGDVHAAGLVDVDGEGQVAILPPGTVGQQFMQLTFTQLREPMIQAGLLTDEDADAFLEGINDDAFIAMNGLTMAVWGRKPK
jgi:hypothetical protein